MNLMVGCKLLISSEFGNAKHAVPLHNPGVGVAAAQKLRVRDYVSSEEHEEVAARLGAAKEQLVEALEELGARDRELAEVSLPGVD